ncbi:hypothetical protein AAY473_004150 [Plecturocebus cupreus]
MTIAGLVWFLTPVILALWEAEAGGSPELPGRLRQENHWNSGRRDCSELRSQHCTPAWATERLRQENCLNLGGGGCSEPRSCHCPPAWRQSKTPSQKIKKEIDTTLIVIMLMRKQRIRKVMPLAGDHTATK